MANGIDIATYTIVAFLHLLPIACAIDYAKNFARRQSKVHNATVFTIYICIFASQTISAVRYYLLTTFGIGDPSYQASSVAIVAVSSGVTVPYLLMAISRLSVLDRILPSVKTIMMTLRILVPVLWLGSHITIFYFLTKFYRDMSVDRNRVIATFAIAIWNISVIIIEVFIITVFLSSIYRIRYSVATHAPSKVTASQPGKPTAAGPFAGAPVAPPAPERSPQAQFRSSVLRLVPPVIVSLGCALAVFVTSSVLQAAVGYGVYGLVLVILYRVTRDVFSANPAGSQKNSAVGSVTSSQANRPLVKASADSS